MARRFRYLALPMLAIAVVVAVQLWPHEAPSTAAPVNAPVADVSDPLNNLAPAGQVLAVSNVDTSDTDRRIAFWQDRLRTEPNSETAWTYLADLLDLKGRQTGDLANFTAARDAYQHAVDIAPLSTTAHLGLAREDSTFHDFQGALVEATNVLEQNSTANGALAIIFDSALELGDLDIATDALSKLDIRINAAAVTVRQARLAFLNGDVSGAQTLAAQAVDESDSSGDEGAGLAFYQYVSAEYALYAGDLDAAQAGYESALQSLPGYYLAEAGEGRVAFAKGDVQTAIDKLSVAVAAVPRPDLVAYLGSLYELSGDRAAADDQYATVEFIAGLSNTGNGRVYDREYSLFLADHTRTPNVAIQLAEDELTVRKDVYGYDTLAWAQFAAGQQSEALATMNRALVLGTVDAKLLIHAGLIELANGLTDEGRTHIQQGLDLHPSFSPLVIQAAREAIQ